MKRGPLKRFFPCTTGFSSIVLAAMVLLTCAQYARAASGTPGNAMASRPGTPEGAETMAFRSGLGWPVDFLGGPILETAALPAVDGSICGTVTDEGGIPLSGMEVHVFDYTTGDGRDRVSVSDEGVYCTGALPAGTYRVEAGSSASYYVTERYDGKPFYEAGDPVEVSADGPTENIDFHLSPGGKICGRVLDDAGGAISGIGVHVSDFATDGWRGGVYTQADGTYCTGAIPEGTYRLQSYGDTDHVPEYYDNKLNRLDADPVGVTAPQTTEQIDFELSSAGRICGDVTDENNSPLSGMQVHLYDYATGDWEGAVYTREDGSYCTSGLPEGTYRVDCHGTGFIPEAYDNRLLWEGGDPIYVLGPLTIYDIDFRLQLDLCPWDFGKNGTVDRDDLLAFIDGFGSAFGTQFYPAPDFDRDGDVDGNDLATFAANVNRTDCPAHQ